MCCIEEKNVEDSINTKINLQMLSTSRVEHEVAMIFKPPKWWNLQRVSEERKSIEDLQSTSTKPKLQTR